MIKELFQRDVKNMNMSEELLTLLASNFVNVHKLNDYVKIIRFNGNPGNCLGYYSTIDKEIVMSADKIMKNTLESATNQFYIRYGYQDEIVKTAFNTTIHILFHELEHAEQKKIVDENKGKENTRNILYDTNLYHEEIDYDQFHDIYPDEHNADAEAALELYNLQKSIGEFASSNEVLSYLLNGYISNDEQLSSPTERFYSLINKPFNISEKNPYVSLLFGMPIDIKLYRKLKDCKEQDCLPKELIKKCYY